MAAPRVLTTADALAAFGDDASAPDAKRHAAAAAKKLLALTSAADDVAAVFRGFVGALPLFREKLADNYARMYAKGLAELFALPPVAEHLREALGEEDYAAESERVAAALAALKDAPVVKAPRQRRGGGAAAAARGGDAAEAEDADEASAAAAAASDEELAELRERLQAATEALARLQAANAALEAQVDGLRDRLGDAKHVVDSLIGVVRASSGAASSAAARA